LETRAEGHAFLQVIVRVAAYTEAGAEAAKPLAKSLARTVSAQFGPSNPIMVLREGTGAESLLARAWTGPARPWADNELGLVAHLTGSDALAHAPQLLTGSAKSLPPSVLLRIPPDARRAQMV
jgi:hypothetical protein